MLLLAEHFLARICEDYGLPTRTLTEDAQAALLAHPWPGNVRELANVLERAALLSDGPRLTAQDLGLVAARRPETTREPAGAESVTAGEDAEAESERRVLLDVLRATGWNFTRAAARLGLPRNTLRYRVERLGLAPEGPPERRRGGRPPSTERAAPAPEPEPEPRSVVRDAAGDAARGASAAVAGRRLGDEPGLEESTAKVRSFGGRIEETGPAELLATFGLEPDEDAPRRAAYAALAVRTLAARARRDAMDVPAIVVALHAEMLPVIREGDVVQRGRRRQQGRPAGARRRSSRARRPAASRPPPRPAASWPAGSTWFRWRAAAARRTARAAWSVTRSPAARASSAATVSCGCCASASSRRRPVRVRSR